MGQAVGSHYSAALEAYERHRWHEAFRLLKEADAAGELDAEGLRVLGKTGEWVSDREACLDALERAHGAFLEAGDIVGAAHVALMLVHTHRNLFADSAGAVGWLRRAEGLLADQPECVEHGWLRLRQAGAAFRRGDFEAGLASFDAAINLGSRYNDPNLVAMALVAKGIYLALGGRHEEGWPYVDEACAAAVGGELGPFATGIVYCNSISAYRDVGEYRRASDWTQTAARWCARQSITGFPGICRVHRAEIVKLRGGWRDAEAEARKACDELRAVTPHLAGDALYEIGEVRLRAGDFPGADASFKQAHELGREPQPGASLLLLARGEAEAALVAIQNVDIQPLAPPIDAARTLAARVEIALAAGVTEVAKEAAGSLETLARVSDTPAMRTLALSASGRLQLHSGDLQALTTLRQAVQGWQELEAPYEVATTRLALALAYERRGDAAGARLELESARAAFDHLGAAWDLKRAESMLVELDTAASPAVQGASCFMFTDIVGSTKLLEAIGDEAWTDLIAWHDQALRACFVRHAGEELDHAGDGFFVAFEDPNKAFTCAAVIQRALAEHRRLHGFAPRVRIGLHSTIATRRGKAWRGKGVHEAARIAALADADQVLASAASVPAGFNTSDRRLVHVEGISERIDVVAVSWR